MEHCIFLHKIFRHRRQLHRRNNRRTAANCNHGFIICHFAWIKRWLQFCRTIMRCICRSFLKNSLPRQQEVRINQTQLHKSSRFQIKILLGYFNAEVGVKIFQSDNWERHFAWLIKNPMFLTWDFQYGNTILYEMECQEY